MEISEKSQKVEKAARIIYYGLENPKNIGTIHEYNDLYKDYEEDSELQEYVKVIAEGLQLTLSRVGLEGVYL
ncbi:MAG: hypothetical protein ACFFCS_25920, partial [Candidatus Hodarchaeota archaeon]